MFGTSKALLAAAVVALAGVMGPATASAQEPTTVTGCLSKGQSEGSFTIKDEGGQSYALTGTAVKLDGHVGHKVTVTGTAAGVETGAMPETGAMAETDAAADTGAMKETTGAADTAAAAAGEHAGEHADKHEAGKDKAMAEGGATLDVTDLKMVSASCS
jgi:hypothetical protein